MKRILKVSKKEETKTAEVRTTDTNKSNSLPLILSVVALILSLVALGLGFRNKNTNQ